MGPPSYMRFVVDRKVVMLRIPVYYWIKNAWKYNSTPSYSHIFLSKRSLMNTSFVFRNPTGNPWLPDRQVFYIEACFMCFLFVLTDCCPLTECGYLYFANSTGTCHGPAFFCTLCYTEFVNIFTSELKLNNFPLKTLPLNNLRVISNSIHTAVFFRGIY